MVDSTIRCLRSRFRVTSSTAGFRGVDSEREQKTSVEMMSRRWSDVPEGRNYDRGEWARERFSGGSASTTWSIGPLVCG